MNFWIKIGFGIGPTIILNERRNHSNTYNPEKRK